MERWQILMKRLPGAQRDEAYLDTTHQGEAKPKQVELFDQPVVLARDGPHGPVIHACNAAAREQGVQAGARLVDMRALCPDLTVYDADEAGDEAALDQLVLWARRWCPWTVKDESNKDGSTGPVADGLVLETTGSDHLFGGEVAMLADMEKRFADLGLTAHLAVAPTWGAAWALSRFASAPRMVCQPDAMSKQLAVLPVSALRLEDACVLLLRRLGLKTVGAVADLPRLSLARRFARAALHANPLMRLDQVMGRQAEPLSSADDPPLFRARIGLPDPIFDPTHYLAGLCEDLCAQLEGQGLGCRRLHLTVYRADGTVNGLMVATSRASRDARHLRGLFNGKLERIDPGFGFDLITLSADVVEAVQTQQGHLGIDGSGREGDVDLSRLIDRLSARLGSHAVQLPAPHESHVPERAERWHAALSSEALSSQISSKNAVQQIMERPVRLLDQPERVEVVYAVPEGPPAQFIWRRQTHRVVRTTGPERIAPEWWRERSGVRLRDYYRIEDQSGRRFWLYREGLHGDGRGADRQGADPQWFLHGMFA
jgi:protein ImuB